jgi:hypothetical protein
MSVSCALMQILSLVQAKSESDVEDDMDNIEVQSRITVRPHHNTPLTLFPTRNRVKQSTLRLASACRLGIRDGADARGNYVMVPFG